MDLEKKKLKEQGEASTRMKLNTLQMVSSGRFDRCFRWRRYHADVPLSS
jgi:hypothetical protein